MENNVQPRLLAARRLVKLGLDPAYGTKPMLPEQPQPEQASAEATPHRRFRFTLAKMIIGFVVLGLVLTFLRYTHWGFIASEAATRIGQKAGMLAPDDTSKIRVAAARVFNNRSFEWRISIPPGQAYYLCQEADWIPREDFPSKPIGFATAWLSEEQLVSIIIGDGEEGHRTRVQVVRGLLPDQSPYDYRYAGDHAWADNTALTTSGILWGDGVQSFDVGERILLLRSTPKQEEGANSQTDRQPGFLIWLEPVPARP